MLIDATFNSITHAIIGAAIEVHRTLGPGLLESIYVACLRYELTLRNVRFVAERRVPILYKTMPLDTHYRIDLIVEGIVLVEVKSVASLLPVHDAQTLTYMKLAGCPAGLLMNFNVPKLIEGVKRLVTPEAAHR